MGWFSNIFGRNKSEDDYYEKLNPAQAHYGNSTQPSREFSYEYERAYEDLEVVNRGVNMIVDDASEIDFVVGEQLTTNSIVTGMRRKSLDKLLNKEPNPFQDISTFRRNLLVDMIVDGNIFIYWDGSHMYHLPASKITIHASGSTYIEKFSFDGKIDYKPYEIIHIKENSFYSIYRGISRLKPALRTMILMKQMRDFQDTFFQNGTVTGLVFKSPNTLSDRIKERKIAYWQEQYNPKTGGRRPLFLDGGLELDRISDVNFKDLDFQASIADNEKVILKALGVPPIMLDSGNNANLRPNMRMYYLETILPITKKISCALERFFGYEISEDLTHIPALQPELRDQSQYYTSLVNAGIITANEARKHTGFEQIEDNEEMNTVRIPQNIAGSAVDPTEGGRPVDTNTGD